MTRFESLDRSARTKLVLVLLAVIALLTGVFYRTAVIPKRHLESEIAKRDREIARLKAESESLRSSLSCDQGGYCNLASVRADAIGELQREKARMVVDIRMLREDLQLKKTTIGKLEWDRSGLMGEIRVLVGQAQLKQILDRIREDLKRMNEF